MQTGYWLGGGPSFLFASLRYYKLNKQQSYNKHAECTSIKNIMPCPSFLATQSVVGILHISIWRKTKSVQLHVVQNKSTLRFALSALFGFPAWRRTTPGSWALALATHWLPAAMHELHSTCPVWHKLDSANDYHNHTCSHFCLHFFCCLDFGLHFFCGLDFGLHFFCGLGLWLARFFVACTLARTFFVAWTLTSTSVGGLHFGLHFFLWLGTLACTFFCGLDFGLHFGNALGTMAFNYSIHFELYF